jgi:hypothetical protein
MSTLATGDVIKHKQSGHEYVIQAIDPYSDTFIARRTSDLLDIDFSLKHFDTVFEVIVPQLPVGWPGLSDWLDDTGLQPKCEPRCECGVDSLGGGQHSDYCPKVGVTHG